MINQAFKNIETSKQYRILDAALREFTEKGYKQASTNQIVKNAGIGKGMLFYYFNSKQDLYLYLVEHGLQLTEKEFLLQIDTTESDFIERLRKISLVKATYLQRHPGVGEFLASVMLTEEVELPETLINRLKDTTERASNLMYENIDNSLFRENIDVEKAHQLIRWSIEGYQNELLSRFKGKKISMVESEPYWQEFYDYLNVLKACYYTSEDKQTPGKGE